MDAFRQVAAVALLSSSHLAPSALKGYLMLLLLGVALEVSLSKAGCTKLAIASGRNERLASWRQQEAAEALRAGP